MSAFGIELERGVVEARFPVQKPSEPEPEPKPPEPEPEPEPERVEVPAPAKPAERKLLTPQVWWDEVRKDHPRRRNEQLVDYAGRLLALMQKADVTKVWSLSTLLRRFHDK